MKRKPAAKNRANHKPATVDGYLARVPEPARGTLERVRKVIRSTVPEGTAEVISYGIPAVKYGQVLVWYAAFSKHCSFFPTAAAIHEFKDELKAYVISKGTIQFPIDAPLPASLVKKMVKFRLAQVVESRR